jgi:hypothetical protein
LLIVREVPRRASRVSFESYRRPKMTEEDIGRGAYLEIEDP